VGNIIYTPGIINTLPFLVEFGYESVLHR